jgi:hypothetical protein
LWYDRTPGVVLKTFELFIFARFLNGISFAFAMFMPLFLAEVAPIEHRGTVSFAVFVR